MSDKMEWPAGLAERIETLKPLLTDSHNDATRARRRLWDAQDRASLLRRQLADAEFELARAERDYNDARDLLRLVWGDFRSGIEAIPVSETIES